MSESNPPWGDVPFADLNFGADCYLSAAYLAPLLTYHDHPSASLIRDFYSAVAPNTPAGFNRTTALEWHDWVLEKDTRLHLGPSETFDGCLPQICGSITRSNPNDLVGIGILVAVALELLLVVAYCGTALALRLRKAPVASVGRGGVSGRVLRAFYTTSGRFFNMAAVFSLGVSVAVVASLASFADSVYYGTLPLLLGAAWFPLAAAAPGYLWSSRRQWLDGALLVVAWAMSTAAIISAPAASYRGYGYGAANRALEDHCPGEIVPPDVRIAVTHALSIFVVLIPAALAVFMGITVACFRCQGATMWSRRWVQTTVRWVVLGYAALSLIGEIAYVLMLLIFAGGSSWIEGSWGLGQGLALALWVPLLYELIHFIVGTLSGSLLVFSCLPAICAAVLTRISVGLDKGLHARLPSEFCAVRIDNIASESNIELMRGSGSDRRAHHGASGHRGRGNYAAPAPKPSIDSATGA